MAEQVNGIGLDVDNGLFEVGATLPQAGSWSIGCDVTIEDVDASVQEVRVNDISLSGSLAIPEVSVDIDANNDKVMNLEIGIATSGLSTGITESQIVPYDKIVKITEFSPESINERRFASSALAAKRIYDLIKEGGAGLNEDELKAFLKRYGYVTEEYVNELLKNASNFFYLSEDGQSIGTSYNIFSEKEISANGLSVGSGGSGSGEGGGLIRTVLTSSSLGSVTSNDNFTTFNAFAIDSIYKKVKSIEEGNVSLSNYYTKSESDARFALLSSLTTVEEKIREILSWFTIDENGNLRTEFNLYSTKEISAGGFNGTGGSTGGGLISTVLGIDKFGTVTTNSNTTTFNAYAIDSLHKRIKSIEESEVDLTGYATEEWVMGRGFITASSLTPYLKTTDFESWKTSSFNPVVSQVNTNKNNIAEILKWFAIDGDGNLYTTYNFYSTKEISSGGFDSGSNGTGGLIGVVYGKSSFGTIANEANNATFNAYAIDSLYKRIVSLENKEVDLTGYATEAWVAGQGFITSAALSPYMKTADATDTFATKTALNNLSSSHDSLATRVSTAEGNISTNAKGIADNKTAIATNKNNISANTTAISNNAKAISGNTTAINTNATAITNLGKRVTANEGNIAEILKWFAVDADGNLYTTYNLYSTKEISANGLSIGSGSSGGGLISQVYGTTAFGTIANESNSATFNAYAIDSLYKRIVLLENKEVDLTGYATETWVLAKNYITSAALSPYLKTADANSTFATLVALNALSGNVGSLEGDVSTLSSNLNTLKGRFDALDDALNDDVSGKINTWNEIVDFLDEYNGSKDLATILSGMNADIALRLKTADFDAWKTDVYSPLASRVSTAESNISTHTTQISGLTTRMGNAETNISTNAKGIAENKTAIATNKSNISANATAITNLGKRVAANEGNIAEILKWFAVDSDGNLYTTYNFYSTKEISANGLSIGSGGSGGGLISQVYGTTAFGTIAAESNSATFNAYAIDSLYKRIVSLEGKATAVSFVPALTSGKQIGTLSIDGVSTVLYGVDAYSKADADGTFLKLSGGKVSGEVKINGKGSLAAPLIIETPSMGYSGYIQFTDGSTDIGWLGFSNKVAVIRQGTTNNTILHANNYSQYALPLSGGTINGGAGALEIKRNGPYLSNIKFSNTDGELGKLGFVWANNPAFFHTDGNYYPLYHTGNFNPANYLPVNGGAIGAGNSNSFPLTISSTSAYTGIAFATSGGTAYMRYQGGSTWGVTDNGWNNSYTLIHSGNIGEYKAGDSDKLGGVSEAEYAKYSTNLYTTYHRYIGYGTTTGGFPQNGGAVVAGIANYSMLLHGRNGVFRFNTMENGSLTGWKTVAFTDSNVASADVIATTYANQSIDIGAESRVRLVSLTASNSVDLGAPKRYVSGLSVMSNYVGWQLVCGASEWDNTDFYIRKLTDIGKYLAWRQIAFTDSNVASATKLATARTIWGQSFDGSGNVSGNITLGAASIRGYDKRNILETTANDLMIGYGYTTSSLKTTIFGNTIKLNDAVLINSSGNVTIGSSDLAGTSAKLYVDGSVYVGNKKVLERVSNNLHIGEGIRGSFDTRIYGTNILFNVSSADNAMMIGIGGNVGIGTTTPKHKLDVNGTLRATGAVTMSSTLSVTEKVTAKYLSVSYDGLRFSDNANYALFMDSDNKVNLSGYYGINLNGAVSVSKALSVTGLITANSGIKVYSGQAITFLDARGKEHKLTYDSTAGAFKFDGNILVVGDGQFNAIN